MTLRWMVHHFTSVTYPLTCDKYTYKECYNILDTVAYDLNALQSLTRGWHVVLHWMVHHFAWGHITLQLIDTLTRFSISSSM